MTCDEISKDEQIEAALAEAKSDASGLTKLRSLALEKGGLLKDEFRQKAWPLLLNCKKRVVDHESEDDGKKCEQGEQVLLDVRRTLKRFPPGIDDETRQDLQESLVTLICRLLVAHPDLHYYQGFHDMALTILLVMLDENRAYEVVEALTLRHLVKFMKPTMNETAGLLDFIMGLIRRENPSLYSHLLRSDVGTTFSLSWVITWFSHCLDNYATIVRIFDAFIASGYVVHPPGQPPPKPKYFFRPSSPQLLPIDDATSIAVFYPLCVSAQLILARARTVMSTECELSAQHAYLSKLPEHVEDWDVVLAKGRKLACKYSMRSVLTDAEVYRHQATARLKGHEVATPGLWESVFCILPYYNSKYHPAKWPPLYRVAFFGLLAAGLFAWYIREQHSNPYGQLSPAGHKNPVEL